MTLLALVLGLAVVAAIYFSSHPSKPPTPEVSKPPSVTPTAPLVVASPSPGAIAPPSPEEQASSTPRPISPSSESLAQARSDTSNPGKAARSLETAPIPPLEGKSIDYLFGALPRQDFTKSAPSYLLEIIKSGGGNIFDAGNGYMRLKGDSGQASLQIALYPDVNGHPYLAIAWGNLGGPDFTHLSFFTERDGRMVAADRTMLPVLDSDKLRFEPAHIGLTLVVRDSNGKVLSKWNWNRDRARFEFAK
jgi:hypothetical protein